MGKYRKYQVCMIVVFSIVVNLVGKYVADVNDFPLWLDALGTCLVAYALGPVAGAVVGAVSNVAYTFYSREAFVYALTSVVVALTVGYGARRGWMKSLFKTMSLSVLVTAISVVVSTALNLVFHGGRTGNVWGDGIIDMLESWHIVFPVRIVVGEFYIDFLDKVITLGVLYGAIRAYRRLRPRLPKCLVMHSACVALSCVAFALVPQGALAQDVPDFSSYIRTVYNSQNGLPGGEANDIASTPDGILWVGTYGGLYRHNGHEFRLMTDFASIKNVNCLLVDDAGRLFVGTNDNGLSVVQDEAVVATVEGADSLPSDSVRSIACAGDGLYYVGTTAALALVSAEGGLFVRGTVPQVVYAKTVCTDGAGHAVAVTNAGGLFLVEGLDAVAQEGSGQSFTAASFAPDGLLYAATARNMLCVYDVSSGGFSLRGQVACEGAAHINSLRFWNGTLFVCADNGAGFVDGAGTYCHMATGAFNNSIDHMIADYQDNIWFSSSRLGLLKMCESAFTEVFVAAGFDEAVVNTVTRHGGMLYFGTDTGLRAVDAATGRAADNALVRRLDGVRIRCLMVDSRGTLWVCTAGQGVLQVFGDGTVSVYGSTVDRWRSALELSDGTVAVCGDNGVLFVRDGQVVDRLDKADGLDNLRVLTMSELRDGTLLCGTDGGGLAIVRDGQVERHVKKRDGLSSDVILRTVNDDTADGVFLVTSNGLCYLDGDRSVRHLDTFPYSNNYDLVQTENGSVFVLGSAGIYVVSKADLLSGAKLDYELLDLKKGLQGSLTANSWNYRDKDNNLYLSCDNGASRLNLDTYNRVERQCYMQVKSVLVDGVRCAFARGEDFVIPSEADTVEIIPEVINYSISNSYVSLYLEGVDERANVMLQSELSSVIYTNLRAGTYRLHLGLLDSKGRSMIGEEVFTLVKVAHFYDNWWFRVYAGFVFMLAIAWLTWYITATRENKRREEQEKELALVKRQVQMGNETIFTIANAVEARDTRTGHHSFRVAEYAVLIAKELGFSQPELENLHKTALLHDIGKIGIPDAILNKPGQLTPEEYAVMKTHVDQGGEILKNFTLIEHVADGAKYHHERYDGSGYNAGLRGEEIPLNARIIGIADAFDAMTANRVYRKTLDIDSVKAELRRCRGTQFDPRLTDIMLRLIEDGTLNVAEIYKRSEEVKQ